MLYNPSWNAKPDLEYDGVTLTGLIAWLEKQSADTQYDARLPGVCLFGLYLEAIGRPRNTICHESWKLTTHNGDFRRIAYGSDPIAGWTFGAALERARALQSAHKLGMSEP